MKEIAIIVDKPNVHKIGLAYSLEQAFKNLGTPVNLVGFNVNNNIYRILKYIPILRLFFLKKQQNEIIDFFSDKNPHIIFVVKGYYLLPQTIQKLKQIFPKTRICCFNPDDPLSKNIGSSNKWIKDSIPHYHTYFMWSRNIIHKLNESYKINAKYMTFAVDKLYIDTILKQKEQEEIYDVSFVGNADNIRLDFIRNLLIEKEKRKSKIAIHLFGFGWENSGIKNAIIHEAVLGDDYYNTIIQSKINLNILRGQNKNAINMRTFEVPGCSKFLLHENSDEAKLIFEEGVEIAYFYDTNDCFNKIENYINSNKRKEIGRNAYQTIVKKELTYEGLCKLILNENY